MKATLTFDLPDEHDEFRHAFEGGLWNSVVWELDQYLRGRIKYQQEEHLQAVRDELYQLANDRGLDITA